MDPIVHRRFWSLTRIGLVAGLLLIAGCGQVADMSKTPTGVSTSSLKKSDLVLQKKIAPINKKYSGADQLLLDELIAKQTQLTRLLMGRHKTRAERKTIKALHQDIRILRQQLKKSKAGDCPPPEVIPPEIVLPPEIVIENTAPVADVGSARDIPRNATVILTGVGTDTEGDALGETEADGL